MKTFEFTALRQKDRWLSPAYVSVDDEGLIISVTEKPAADQNYEVVKGLALPAFVNVHSHAFQYAMAGLAEVHEAGNSSDFWSWRNKMYQIALSVDPDDLQAIATMLYSEMVRHGYGHVVEFHYLHHDKNGKSYENITELGERLIIAAKEAGINITLAPMLYQQGGFNKAPEEHQRRFISSTEQYLDMFRAYEKLMLENSHLKLGYGAHSIRAVDKKNINAIITELGDNYPFHIHIAEQLKEVEEAREILGRRPVQWLMDNFNVNENFNLVHATHLEDDETRKIANSKANVVLCPSTEGNLGDGIFPFHQYQELNGRWCIGTDSHIGLNPMEELRILDYGQRLTTHKRNTFYPLKEDGVAQALKQVVFNGAKAGGEAEMNDFFQHGSPFNALIIDDSHPLLQGSADFWLPTIIFHFDSSNNHGTIINGEWTVKKDQHIARKSTHFNFAETLKKLKIRIQ